jgi:HEPN domain-containing protein
MMSWKEKLENEFDQAQLARDQGNEGKARVCARRAAGIAIREYFARQGRSVHTSSAYDLLRMLAEEPNISPDLSRAAAYLIIRVTEEFKLPVEVDLLAEARNLCNGLLAE